MTRLIDADALKELFIQTLENIKSNPRMTGQEMHIITAIHTIGQMIDDAPTIDAEPVRHGKWRIVNCATGLRCQCSECLHWVDAGTDKNYCPNCGADMRGEEEWTK